jgi:hypothetical protein
LQKKLESLTEQDKTVFLVQAAKILDKNNFEDYMIAKES